MGVIGAVLLVIGGVVGLIPVSSGGADCGSALMREDWLGVALSEGEAAADGCESLLSILAIPTWALLALGVLLVIAAVVWATRKSTADVV